MNMTIQEALTKPPFCNDQMEEFTSVDFLRHVVEFCNSRSEWQNKNKGIVQLMTEYAEHVNATH